MQLPQGVGQLSQHAERGINMRTLLIVFTLALLSSRARAADPATRCFDAGSNRSFFTSEIIPLGGALDAKMPHVEIDSDGKPTKLTWVPRPEDTTIDVQELGRYQGKGIYYVIYRKESVTPETPGVERSECVMLGYQFPTSEYYTSIRPFFVAFRDDQSSWGQPIFTAEKARPFGLEIGVTYSGNGMYWQDYTFVFTTTEARIAERREGGRKVPVEVHRYNKAGLIISTGTSSKK